MGHTCIRNTAIPRAGHTYRRKPRHGNGELECGLRDEWRRGVWPAKLAHRNRRHQPTGHIPPSDGEVYDYKTGQEQRDAHTAYFILAPAITHLGVGVATIHPASPLHPTA
jgi:hypothetical protein